MINAAGYQMAIMPQLHEAGSDHVLTVKHRQPHLLTTVQTAFADTAPSTFTPEGQDRCRTRKLVAKPACSPGLRSLIRVGCGMPQPTRPPPSGPYVGMCQLTLIRWPLEEGPGQTQSRARGRAEARIRVGVQTGRVTALWTHPSWNPVEACAPCSGRPGTGCPSRQGRCHCACDRRPLGTACPGSGPGPVPGPNGFTFDDRRNGSVPAGRGQCPEPNPTATWRWFWILFCSRTPTTLPHGVFSPIKCPKWVPCIEQQLQMDTRVFHRMRKIRFVATKDKPTE